MAHTSPLVGMLVAALGLAFILGTLANRLRLSPLVGYLLAGIAIGPFTPGYVADSHLALQFAEIGVILLMFGVGLHFSLSDLMSVRRIVLPGAVLQVAVSTAIGGLAGSAFGWPMSSAIVFGAALSVASTVVLTRALQERRLMDSEQGRIAVGWLVVQDLVTILILVLLPALAPLLRPAVAQHVTVDFASIAAGLAETLAKLAGFFLLMWIVGRRVIPLVLHYAAHSGSRELFRLAVLSVALGVAFAAAELFGVSIALGAFFAGMILSESPLSRRAAEESLPLRDAFAVLFFVSVGMLFNPRIFLSAPLHLLMTVAAVVVGTTFAAFVVLRLLGVRTAIAAPVAAGLAQIGEFSFVLINLGIGLNLLPLESRDLILGTAILSILVNPILLVAAQFAKNRFEAQIAGAVLSRDTLVTTGLVQHAVIVGYGRVGSLVAEGLKHDGTPFLVIEEAAAAIARLRSEGVEVLAGSGADERVLKAANLPVAQMLFVAIPEAFEAGQIVQQARRANPKLDIVARAHFDAEFEHLMQLGASTVIVGEREIAEAMLLRARGAQTG